MGTQPPTHIIEFYEYNSYDGIRFYDHPMNTDERIVNRLVGEAKWPEYGFPRTLRGWRVTEVETGRVLAEEDWPHE